jgi:tryptophan-rich sensory protein
MNESYSWYATLIKPTWAPPSWLFGPVWSVLYAGIVISFGSVFYKIYTKEVPWTVGVPFVLNLIFNLSFTPLQFGLKSNLLASVDILLILGTLVWAIVAVFPHVKWIAYAQGPYLLWVIFATVLQITITYLN